MEFCGIFYADPDPGLAQALALTMIVIVVIVMSLYTVLQRRTSRWLR